MAETLKIGTRLLFAEHPGGEVKAGVVEEYSPTLSYVGLSVGRGEAWLPANRLIVVEVLEVPADKPLKAVKAPTSPKGEVGTGAEKTDETAKA